VNGSVSSHLKCASIRMFPRRGILIYGSTSDMSTVLKTLHETPLKEHVRTNHVTTIIICTPVPEKWGFVSTGNSKNVGCVHHECF
jgi:hypothetical protein